MKEKIRSYINNNQLKLSNLLKEMIACPTVNPPGDNYAGFVEKIVYWGEQSNVNFQVVEMDKNDGSLQGAEVHGPRFAILFHLPGQRGHRRLVFQGHYDTVIPSGAWQKNPFSPRIEGERLYGLGSTDMKGGLAAMIMACLTLKTLKIPMNGDLYFLATPDEEFPSNRGLNYFLNKLKLDFDGAIIGEPSGGDRIMIGMKGGTWGDIIIKGRSCHGSRPQLGVNAFEKMAGFISAAETVLKPTIYKSVSDLGFVPEKNNHNTLMFGGIVQGSNTSRATVPDLCRVSFDLRTIPDEPALKGEKLLRTFVKHYAKEHSDIKIEIVPSSKMEAFALNEGDKLLQILSKSVHETIGQKPFHSISSGALETYLFHKRDVPTLSFGPGSLSLAHAPDEFVELGALVSAAEIYALTAYRYLK